MPSESIDIDETQDSGQRRVIRHTFYGRDQKEVKRNERAHRKSDRFFDAAMKGKEFKGIPVTAKKISKRRRRTMAKKHKRKARRGGKHY